MNRYEAPAFASTSFNCPHCGVRAIQHWANLYKRNLSKGRTPHVFEQSDLEHWEAEVGKPDLKVDPYEVIAFIQRGLTGEVFCETQHSDIYAHQVNNLNLAICDHCDKVSVWLAGRMIFPLAGEIAAHDDLPEHIRRTFAEASKIVEISPRASAALSRLVLQELCGHLECKSGNLNDQIGELVQKGLPPDIKQMLDAVRVIGNNAVHPGEIDLKDDEVTAKFILNCINRICQRMITEKLEAQKLFDQLPQGAKEAIEKRDAKTKAAGVAE